MNNVNNVRCFTKVATINLDTVGRVETSEDSRVFGKGFQDEDWGVGEFRFMQIGEQFWVSELAPAATMRGWYWWKRGEGKAINASNRIFLGDRLPQNYEIVGNHYFVQ